MSGIQIEATLVDPETRVFVSRQEVLATATDKSARVRVETIHRLGRVISSTPPPIVNTTCDRTNTWTFSGSHRTDGQGTKLITLNNFIPDCIDGYRNKQIGSYPHFTATPETEQPVFLTCSITAILSGGSGFSPPSMDVKIKVFSWLHDGAQAPGIPFNWIAITELANPFG